MNSGIAPLWPSGVNPQRCEIRASVVSLLSSCGCGRKEEPASGIVLLGTERLGQEVRSHTGHKGDGAEDSISTLHL